MRCFIVRELYGNSTGIVREGIERVYVEIGRGAGYFCGWSVAFFLWNVCRYGKNVVLLR